MATFKRHTGQTCWLEYAETLGHHLIKPQLSTNSDAQMLGLFWGKLGCALALEEITYPEQACMPLFGNIALT